MELFEKLNLCAKIGDGYFFTKMIVGNKKERAVFDSFKFANKSKFKKVWLGKKFQILKLNNEYNVWAGLPTFQNKPVSKTEIVRKLLWNSYCIELGIEKKFPNKNPDYEIFVDDFLSDESDFNSVITIQSRGNIFISSDVIIPTIFKIVGIGQNISNYLSSIEFNRESFVQENFTDESFLYNEIEWESQVLDSGTFPLSVDEIHLDKRDYIGFPEKISGFEKWHLDINLMENGKVPPLYKLGIWEK